ncbi:MAG: hypothetical protein ABIC95_02945 [archaeon]
MSATICGLPHISTTSVIQTNGKSKKRKSQARQKDPRDYDNMMDWLLAAAVGAVFILFLAMLFYRG